jgi:hypothetical protein
MFDAKLSVIGTRNRAKVPITRRARNTFRLAIGPDTFIIHPASKPFAWMNEDRILKLIDNT